MFAHVFGGNDTYVWIGMMCMLHDIRAKECVYEIGKQLLLESYAFIVFSVSSRTAMQVPTLFLISLPKNGI